MIAINDLALYFYIACGIAGSLFLFLFIMIGVLLYKIKHLINDRSSQTHFQPDVMSDFCYTNPMIVPGEELSRRGFSIYRGSNPMSIQTSNPLKNNNYEMFNESHSKF